MDAMRRRTLAITGLLLIAAVCGLGAWAAPGPFAIDAAWDALMLRADTPALHVVSLVLDWVGGGWRATYVVPLGGALVLVLVRRPWGAAFFLLSLALSAGAVQVLKSLYARARPEDMMVVSDFGSFPSGHTANAATLAVVLFVLFPRVWVGVAGGVWTCAMGASRTFVHAHWLSDTLGGALIGAGVVLLLAAAFGPRVREVRLPAVAAPAPPP